MLSAVAGMMAPFLIAALGGLFTERAGVLNIALEGQMLIGAFTAAAVAGATGSIVFGLTAAMAVSGFIAYAYATLSLRLKANIFITAIAVNLFAMGGTQIASQIFFHTKGVVQFEDFPALIRFSIPVISGLPFIGQLFTDQSILIYVSWILVPCTAWLLFSTPFGLRIRAAGFNDTALYARGVSSRKVREKAVALSGVSCGLAGAILAFHLGAYVPNITSGRGWIALVAIFLGYSRPGGILLVSFLFASAEWIAQRAQGMGNLPSSLLLAFPFFITFLGMILFSIVSGSLLRSQKKN